MKRSVLALVSVFGAVAFLPRTAMAGPPADNGAAVLSLTAPASMVYGAHEKLRASAPGETGTVTFFDGGSPYASVPLTFGVAQVSLSSGCGHPDGALCAHAGSHVFTATLTEPGGQTLQSEPAYTTVTPDHVIITVEPPSAEPVTYGARECPPITIRPALPDSTVYIPFQGWADKLVGLDNGEPAGIIDQSYVRGHVRHPPCLFLETVPPGDHALQVVFLGTPDLLVSRSNVIHVTVVKAVPGTDLFSTANPLPHGTPGAVVAYVKPDNENQDPWHNQQDRPTGTITFLTSDGRSLTEAFNWGAARLPLKGFPPGTYDVTASYSGDSNYTPVLIGTIRQVIT